MQKVEAGWCISVINAAGVVVSKSCTSERTTNDGGSVTVTYSRFLDPNTLIYRSNTTLGGYTRKIDIPLRYCRNYPSSDLCEDYTYRL